MLTVWFGHLLLQSDNGLLIIRTAVPPNPVIRRKPGWPSRVMPYMYPFGAFLVDIDILE